MMRGRLAQAALRCYPPTTRAARGAEMLDTLLEASDGRHGVFAWNVVSLVRAGLGERGRASARLSAGRTIAEAAKLASILYACLWLTAGLAVLVDRPGWPHSGGRISVYLFGLLIVLLAWSLGHQRLAGVIGLACTVPLVVAHRPDLLLPASLVQPILPASGYLIMAIAPTRGRPNTIAVAALATLVLVSAIVPGAHASAFSEVIVLAIFSIAGLAVFAVQPRLAIAAAIIWTALGIELIAFTSGQPVQLKLLVVAAPAVLAATAARARVIRRRAA